MPKITLTTSLAAIRGRVIVDSYAALVPDFGDSVDEHVTAAGDLIADVLAYTLALPDHVVPAAYRGDAIERIATVAARGVWNTLAMHPADADAVAGEDPDPDAVGEAIEAFARYLVRC